MKGDETLNGSPQNVVPLRTILQNFLNLVENYEARRNGGLDAYDAEFQELKQFSESLKPDVNYSCKEGERSVNRKKNRYKDILPFDYSRVKLDEIDDSLGSDYINASIIKGASGSAAYIAAQGPLPSTLNSFWQCIWEQQVQVIVMACNEQESGKHKCENYWVDEDESEREFGPITVWLKKCRNICPDFLIRTMRIRHTDIDGKIEERNVCQFHYSAWPDHSVPKEVKPLLDMVRLIRDCQTSETLPVLVHCSAGCGRTGTICAIDQIWGLLRLGRLSPDFSLFNLVKEMRRQRIAMVQTKDQYILVHRAVKELFQEQLKIIDAHTYANVDINGLPIEIKKELEEPTYETLEFSTEVKKNRSLLPSSAAPLPPTLTNKSIVDANDIIVSVGNINTNGITMNQVQRSLSLSPKLDVSLSSSNHISASIPSRGKSSSSKLEKEVENYQKHMEQEKNRGKNSTRSKMVPGDTQKKTLLSLNDDDDDDDDDDNGTGERESKVKYEKDREMKNSSNNNNNNTSDTELSDREKKKEQQNKSSTTSSSSGSNSIRSALLRKPSIVKLKSFFEKMSKEEKERKHATGQLSRTKSDLSTRFYSFNNPFGSKSQSSTTTTTSSSSSGSKQIASTSSKNASPTSQDEPSSSSSSNSKTINGKPQKPPTLAKPILPIKRSKSLKVTLVPDSVKFSAFTSHKRSEPANTNKKLQQQKVDSSLSSNPSTGSSMGSSSSSGGFLNIIDNTNPIKVCVKQVEMPKLQAIVSKSVKPEAHRAATTTTNTITTTSLEDHYDIDDRSHLRRETNSNNNNSTSVSNNQSFTNIEPPPPPLPQTKTMESSNQLSGPSSSFSSSLPTRGEHKTTNSSPGFHVLNDNHNNYVNFSYTRNNHNTKTSNDKSGSSKGRNKTGMAREMEDLLGVHHQYSDSKMKYDKLKKCDTVNPRLLAASLGLSKKNERTSLTRSQSHVWQQFDKTPTPVRIFSNDNIYQSSPPPPLQSSNNNTSFKIGRGENHKRNSLELQPTIVPSKHEKSEYYSTTSSANTNNNKNNNGFIIQAINADVSVKPLGPLGLYENIRPSSSNNSYNNRESEGNSNYNTLKTSSSSSLDMTDKPLVRRRVPKTNPYANYPACVTGSNSKFPFQSSSSSSPPPPPPSSSTYNNNNNNNNNNHIGNESLKPTIPQSDDNFLNHHNSNSNNTTINYSNYTTSGHYSSIPPLKIRGSNGSVGNSSSDSSSNMGTPRNSSLPSTPTQSVDILYPPLLRPNNHVNNNNNNNNNNNSSQYPTKSILKESLPSTPSESDEKIDTCSTTKFFSNIPNTNNSSKNNHFSNNNSTSAPSSNIPKINTIRIAVGVRERRNSFRQAVWKESSTPQNNNNNNKKDDINGNPSNNNSSSNNNNNNNTSITSIRNPSPSTSIRPQYNESLTSNNPVPLIHKNYEPIWPETPSTSYSNSNKTRHLPSYSTAILRNESRQNAEMNQKQLQLQPPLIPAPSSQNIPINKTTSNSSSFNFHQDSIHNNKSTEIKTEHSNSNAAQAKIDEIKLMLAELNANPKGSGSSNSNNSSGIYGKSMNHNNPFSNTSSSSFSNPGNSSIKQQRSLRAPSRAQYQQQQGLSCFRKQTSYESIVDQLQADEDDEYPLLARSNFMPQATKNIPNVHHTQQQQQQQEPHYGVLRTMSTLGKVGEVNNVEGARLGNDYVVLRQCKTYENSNTTSAVTTQQTPIPPPRLKRQQHMINNANNYQHHLQQQHQQTDLKPNHTAVVGSGGITVHMSSQNNSNSTSMIKNQQQQLKNPYMNIPSSTEKMMVNDNGSSASSSSFSSFIKSRFASKNWTETKDRSNNNSSSSSNSIKRGYENGTSESIGAEQEFDCGEPIKAGLNTKSLIGNHPSISGPILTKHQYL